MHKTPGNVFARMDPPGLGHPHDQVLPVARPPVSVRQPPVRLRLLHRVRLLSHDVQHEEQEQEAKVRGLLK